MWEALGVVSALLLGGILGYIGSCRLIDRWAMQEEQAARERLNRIMSAQEPRTWPTPKGPHGFTRRVQ